MFILRSSLAMWAFFLLVACDARQQETNTATDESVASFSTSVQPIFDVYCVQCHALEQPQAGLVLEDGMSFDMLVGVPSTESEMLRVKPGFPEESYLMHKLRGSQLAVGGSGLGMPLTEGIFMPLDDQNIAMVESWIRNEAKVK